MQDDAKGIEQIELKKWSCGRRTERTFIIMFKTVKDVPKPVWTQMREEN